MKRKSKHVYINIIICCSLCLLLIAGSFDFAFADNSIVYCNFSDFCTNYQSFFPSPINFYDNLNNFKTYIVNHCSSDMDPDLLWQYLNTRISENNFSDNRYYYFNANIYNNMDPYNNWLGVYECSSNSPELYENIYYVTYLYVSFGGENRTYKTNNNGIHGGWSYSSNDYKAVYFPEGSYYHDMINNITYVYGEAPYITYSDITYTSSTTLDSGITINNLDRVSIFEDNTEIEEGVNTGSTIGDVALNWIQNLGIWHNLAEATGLIVHDRENDLLYVDPDPSNYTYFSDYNTGTATMYNGWIDENNVYHRNMRTSEGWVNMPDYDSHYRHVAYSYNIRTGESSYNKNGLDGVIIHTDTSDVYLANGSSALEMYEAIQNSAHKTVNTGHYLVNNTSFSSNLQNTVSPYIQNNKLYDIYGLLNAIKSYEYVDLVSQKYANNSLSEILGYVIDAVDLLTDIKHYLGWGTFDNTHMCLEWIMLGLGVPYYDGSDYIINQSNMPIAEILTRNYLALTSRQNNGLIANTYEYDGETISNPYYFLSQYMDDNHINIGYIEQSVESLADDIVSGIEDILEDVFPQSQPDTNTTIINNITNVENDINISGENITSGYSLLNRIVGFFKYTVSDSVDFVSLVTDNDNWQLWSEEAYYNFGY